MSRIIYLHFKCDALSYRCLVVVLRYEQGRRDLQTKEALPQAPPPRKYGAPPKISGPPRNFGISDKFSIRLLKAREERKPNKVIEKAVLTASRVVHCNKPKNVRWSMNTFSFSYKGYNAAVVAAPGGTGGTFPPNTNVLELQ